MTIKIRHLDLQSQVTNRSFKARIVLHQPLSIQQFSWFCLIPHVGLQSHWAQLSTCSLTLNDSSPFPRLSSTSVCSWSLTYKIGCFFFAIWKKTHTTCSIEYRENQHFTSSLQQNVLFAALSRLFLSSFEYERAWRAWSWWKNEMKKKKLAMNFNRIKFHFTTQWVQVECIVLFSLLLA